MEHERTLATMMSPSSMMSAVMSSFTTEQLADEILKRIEVQVAVDLLHTRSELPEVGR